VTLQEIFRFKETGFDKNRRILGQFQAMGFIPTFVEKLEQKGVIISRDIFSNQPAHPAQGGGQNPQALRPAVTPVSLFKPTGTGGGKKS
jgi:septum site-determining protein MinD